MTDVPDDDAILTPTAEHEEVVGELSQLLLLSDAVKFGRYPLKSGKISMYQIDASALCGGHSLYTVGRAVAKTIQANFGDTIDVLLAASVDAIPIATIGVLYYALLTGHDASWAYTRYLDLAMNEPPRGGRLGENRQAVIVESVLCDGDDVRNSVHTIKSTGAFCAGICALVDRRERHHGRFVSSILAKETGIKVVSAITVVELAAKIPDGVFTLEQRDYLTKS